MRTPPPCSRTERDHRQMQSMMAWGPHEQSSTVYLQWLGPHGETCSPRSRGRAKKWKGEAQAREASDRQARRMQKRCRQEKRGKKEGETRLTQPKESGRTGAPSQAVDWAAPRKQRPGPLTGRSGSNTSQHGTQPISHFLGRCSEGSLPSPAPSRVPRFGSFRLHVPCDGSRVFLWLRFASTRFFSVRVWIPDFLLV